jgi:GNAT superfamily N-acetyltransferase
MIRRLTRDDLPGLMRLYGFLHPEEISPPASDPVVQKTWESILADLNQHYYGVETDGQLISTCLMTIIPNLTRGTRPYGLIENVITDPDHRKQGHATNVLQFALSDAWASGCYKVMLLTGSKSESTLRFYEKSGFQRNVKTGFVAYPATT